MKNLEKTHEASWPLALPSGILEHSCRVTLAYPFFMGVIAGWFAGPSPPGFLGWCPNTQVTVVLVSCWCPEAESKHLPDELSSVARFHMGQTSAAFKHKQLGCFSQPL